MPIKTTMRYDFTSVIMAIINKSTTSVGKDLEKREPEYTVSGNPDWCNHCEKQYGISSEN